VAGKMKSPNRELFLVQELDIHSLLSIAPLASKGQTPVLQNAKSKLNSDVKKFIRDEATRKVTVIGSFDESLKTELQKLGVSVETINGGSDEMTSLRIAETYYPSISTVAIVKADEVANYLTLSRLALDEGFPILFAAEPDRLIKDVMEYLNEQQINQYYLLGGLNEEIVMDF